MTECDADIFYVLNEKAAASFQRIYNERDKTLEWYENKKAEIRAQLARLKTNGPPKLETSSKKNKSKRLLIETTSENDDSKLSNESVSGKSKRNASKLAQLKINHQAQMKLNSKMRRPGNNHESPLADISNMDLMCIKKENIEVEPDPISENDLPSKNMPPPTIKPKRGRTRIKKEIESSDPETEKSETGRVTRSKRAMKKTEIKNKISTSTRRPREDSDVIIQEEAAPLISISDSDNEDIPLLKKSQAVKKILEDFESEDDEPIAKPKNRKKTKKIKKTSSPLDKSVYEDAVADELKHQDKPVNVNNLNVTNVIEKPLNETHVIEKLDNSTVINSTQIIEKQSILVQDQELRDRAGISLNCTVVLEKANQTVTSPQWKKATVTPPMDSLLTDDESIVKKTPDKKPARKGIKTKQMFSPYANSPVRKRVAAFEKLTANELPGRVTRTKTRTMNEEKAETVKAQAKPKFVTPLASNKLLSLIPQSDGKIHKQGLDLPMKSQTAVKPSRLEQQQRREEEQRKRLEKELEAKQKRDALIQAKVEEQRRKREEKQLKAQKLRDEILREKEEKLRQIVKEKDEKVLEDQQRKREWNTKKLAEMEERKRLEEQNKIIMIREQQKQKLLEEKRRKQLATKPPPLPTDHFENSDDSSSESERKAPYKKPVWAQRENLYPALRVQACLPKSFLKSLFQMGAQTPDLQEIFETIDGRALRRNSSAVWNTPPRYSTLPKF